MSDCTKVFTLTAKFLLQKWPPNSANFHDVWRYVVHLGEGKSAFYMFTQNRPSERNLDFFRKKFECSIQPLLPLLLPRHFFGGLQDLAFKISCFSNKMPPESRSVYCSHCDFFDGLITEALGFLQLIFLFFSLPPLLCARAVQKIFSSQKTGTNSWTARKWIFAYNWF